MSFDIRLLCLFLAVIAIGIFPAKAEAAPQELGLNAHQSADVGMDVAKAAKVKWVRLDFNWTDLEPSSGTFNFAPFDALVSAATSHGKQVLAVLAYAPAWASSGDTKGDGTNNDVPADGAYAAFVTAVVTHFKSNVTHYELWNEPNLTQFFEGSTSDYTSRILVPGADALHAACASCSVVAPAVASVGSAYDTWLDASLTAAQSKIDIVSGHIYAPFQSEDSTAGLTADGFFNKLEAHRIVQIGGVTVFEGPKSYREVMLAHTCNAPFWLTETGLGAATTDDAALTAQATRYTNTLEAMNGRAWWTSTIFYEAFDEPGTGNTFGVSLHNTSNALGYDAKPALGILSSWVFPPSGSDAGVFLDGGTGFSGTASNDAGMPLDAGAENGDGKATSNGNTSNSDGSSGCSVARADADPACFLGVTLIAFSLRRSRRRRRPR
ncbi:MAG: cellulase family glycosylhydrolase [Polyangiaceae bacterium]